MPRTKYEHVNSLKGRADLNNAFCCSLDISDAFHHFRMREQHRIFMSFSSPTGPNGEEEIYEALSMPFGEAIAPWRLTKLLREPFRRWRAMGINLLVYLDEILVFHADPEILAQQVQFMLNDGPLSGILWSQSKSVIIPTRIIEHQGIILNTIANTFSLPERRYRKIVDLARSLLSAPNR